MMVCNFLGYFTLFFFYFFSLDRYYDNDKGDCFPCSKCCHDDHDVEKDECKQKLGAGSHMICSFDSSVNRCDKSTPSPQKPTTITNQSKTTSTSDYTSSSQGSKHEHTVPTTRPTAQPRHHPSTTVTAKSFDKLISFTVPVVLTLLIIAACYMCKARIRQMCGFPWCSCPDSGNKASKSRVVHYKPNKNLGRILI